jgi:hypothetical protein
MITIPQWTRFERKFLGVEAYANPIQDVEVRVEFTSENGSKQNVAAFWDGDRTWKVRFSPEETGKWTYHTNCSARKDTGLHNQCGELQCVPYNGDNPLFRHGALRVSRNRRYFIHADGTPFFWLGDTVWNGPLKADMANWSEFLDDRAAKGFNITQFVTTQWVAGAGNADARLAYSGVEEIHIDPAFFRWLDHRIDAINDHGMVGAPALIWSAPSRPWTSRQNPGGSLSDDQIIVLARYLVARYGAHQVVWILAGDSDYRGAEASRWKRIARAVFTNTERLATMHPAGQIWVADEFRNEAWFSFNGYQSSHWGTDQDHRWINEGPPSQDWKTEPHHPIVNLEPCYEGHIEMRERRRIFDAYEVRRACYWSLLASPPAGLTYGCHGIWSWELAAEEPMNHPGTGVAPPWQEAVAMPGSTSMQHLKNIFASVEWWRLIPAPELVVNQPGRRFPARFVAAARSESGDLAMVYLPEGGKVELQMNLIRPGVTAEWIDPATGDRTIEKRCFSAGVQLFEVAGTEDRTLLFSTPGLAGGHS